MKPRVQFKSEPQIFQSPRKSRLKATSSTSSQNYLPHHRAEARQSLARVSEIQKYAKVLPHCSSAVRLNHLSRCRPLQPPVRGANSQSFESLYHAVSNLAVNNSNKQLPLPTNNFPKIPRKKKHKKTSSKRCATSHTKVPHAPAIIVSKELETNKLLRGNPLLNNEDRKNKLASIFNFRLLDNIESISIKDLTELPCSHYIEVLEMFKLKTIELENEIEQTDKIDCPTDARRHVRDLEGKLIKVMPQMNLVSDLVKFNRMHDEYKQSNQQGNNSLVVLQEESIKLVLFEIHQLEGDILEINSEVSSTTYELEYLEMENYNKGSTGETENRINNFLGKLLELQKTLERLALEQTDCEEKVMSLRGNVQRYVGSNINSTASIFMLNIDSQLGLVMMTLNQLGKKRQAALEKVTEEISRRQEENKSRKESSAAKSDEEYIEIIDRLTKEMFEYRGQDTPSHSTERVHLATLSGGECEYERVMRELDEKLKSTSLEINKMEKTSMSISSCSSRLTKKAKKPSLEIIDKLFDPPEKIEIPLRYQPYLDLEEEEGEEEAREVAKAEKSCEIRRMVSDITRQSEDTLTKSREIARLAATKSSLLAASATSKDNMDNRTEDSEDEDEEDESPLILPIHQQRDSLIL